MEEDVPYNDEFEQMESSTDEDEEEEEADEPKVCSMTIFFVLLSRV
jgi:hypothetical protein